jgi:hypothetical protein
VFGKLDHERCFPAGRECIRKRTEAPCFLNVSSQFDLGQLERIIVAADDNLHRHLLAALRRTSPAMARKPFLLVAAPANDLENQPAQSRVRKLMRNAAVNVEAILQQALLDDAVLENVRRYRAIASLCRQTAAFRPVQKLSLLQQAEEWERLAIRELESHREEPVEMVEEDLEPQDGPEAPLVDPRWWLPRREGLFAGLQA